MTAVKVTTLAAALVQAQAEMPAVEKDATNPHFRSSFTSLDHLIAKTRPVLAKHGLAITQTPTHLDGQPALATTLLHESGEQRTDVMPLLVAKGDMQGLGSAITYGKRYMWAAVLGVSTEDDDDGNAASSGSAADTAVTAAVERTPPRSSGQAGAASSAPATPSPEQVATLMQLVEEKGGDLDAFKAALETASGQANYRAWFEFQQGHWEKQPKPSAFKVPPKVKAAA